MRVNKSTLKLASELSKAEIRRRCSQKQKILEKELVVILGQNQGNLLRENLGENLGNLLGENLGNSKYKKFFYYINKMENQMNINLIFSKLTKFLTHPIVLISIIVVVFICFILSIVSMLKSSKVDNELTKTIETQKDCKCGPSTCECSDDSCKCGPSTCECPPDSCKCPETENVSAEVSKQITNLKTELKSDLETDVSSKIADKIGSIKPGVSKPGISKSDVIDTVKSTLKNEYGLHIDKGILTSDNTLKASSIYTDTIASSVAPTDSFIAIGQQYINIENKRSQGGIRLAAYEREPYLLEGDINQNYKYYDIMSKEQDDINYWTPGLSPCNSNGDCPVEPDYECTGKFGYCKYALGATRDHNAPKK